MRRFFIILALVILIGLLCFWVPYFIKNERVIQKYLASPDKMSESEYNHLLYLLDTESSILPINLWWESRQKQLAEAAINEVCTTSNDFVFIKLVVRYSKYSQFKNLSEQLKSASPGKFSDDAFNLIYIADPKLFYEMALTEISESTNLEDILDTARTFPVDKLQENNSLLKKIMDRKDLSPEFKQKLSNVLKKRNVIVD